MVRTTRTDRPRHALARDAHRALRSIARRYPASDAVRMDVARALAAISALDTENHDLRRSLGREVEAGPLDLFGTTPDPRPA